MLADIAITPATIPPVAPAVAPPRRAPPGHTPSHFDTLVASAWAETICAYWDDLQQAGLLDAQAPLDVVDWMPGDGGPARLMLQALLQRTRGRPGIEQRLRYLACVADEAHIAAWRHEPELHGLLDRHLLVPVLWPLDGEEPPHLLASGGALRWCGANPVVVLAHDRFRHLPQRLLGTHYGRLLEASPHELVDARDGDDASRWRAVDEGALTPLQRTLVERHVAGLNSAPVCLPVGAMQALARVAVLCPAGYLVLSAARGFADDRGVRLGGFDSVLSAFRRDRLLPADFSLLATHLGQQGVRVWQRAVGDGDVVQAVAGGAGSSQAALQRWAAPLARGDCGDGAALARVMRAAVRDAGAAAGLVVLRRAHHDPRVFAAACPDLHLRWLGRSGVDREAWAEALRCVWAQHLPSPDAPPLFRDVALSAMRIAEWGFARRVWLRGLAVHGPSAPDLAQLAWCESCSGDLEAALRHAAAALACKQDDPLARDVQQRLDERLAGWDEAPGGWLRCIARQPGGLALEPLDGSHAPALGHQFRDPQIAVMSGFDPIDEKRDAATWVDERRRETDRMDYAVMHAEHGFVGHTGVYRWARAGFFYFWIGIDHQGRGFAAQAGALLCEFALRNGVDCLLTSCYGDNVRSRRALERIGFRRLPVRRRSDKEPLHYLVLTAPGVDVDAMAVLRDYHVREEQATDFEPDPDPVGGSGWS
jgi:RimJ/RimL family protein N-acetyltransferase